jgi:hypothetical protein
MTLNEMLRAIAGFFVLLSVALGWFVSPYWFAFTAFVGVNLIQSAFTKVVPDDRVAAQARRARGARGRVLLRLGLARTRAG